MSVLIAPITSPVVGVFCFYKEVNPLKPKFPRLVEARYVFQLPAADGDPDHAQFAIALFLRDGKIRVAFDIHGDGPGVENIDVSLSQAILAAAEMVKSKVKVGELHEQVE